MTLVAPHDALISVHRTPQAIFLSGIEGRFSPRYLLVRIRKYITLARIKLTLYAANNPVSGVGPVQALQRGDDETAVAWVDADAGRRVGLAAFDDSHGLERSERVGLYPLVDGVELGSGADKLHSLYNDWALSEFHTATCV